MLPFIKIFQHVILYLTLYIFSSSLCSPPPFFFFFFPLLLPFPFTFLFLFLAGKHIVTSVCVFYLAGDWKPVWSTHSHTLANLLKAFVLHLCRERASKRYPHIYSHPQGFVWDTYWGKLIWGGEAGRTRTSPTRWTKVIISELGGWGRCCGISCGILRSARVSDGAVHGCHRIDHWELTPWDPRKTAQCSCLAWWQRVSCLKMDTFSFLHLSEELQSWEQRTVCHFSGSMKDPSIFIHCLERS